jgi:transposase
LARRHYQLTSEIEGIDSELVRLTSETAPALVDVFGIGPDTAATLLVTAGSNPERLRSEAAFAALCGVNPIPASSGKTNRHRLNRGGDRQANSALYRIVLVRLRYHKPTMEYMSRRMGEGMTKPEIIRCLKRYVARQIYPVLREMGDKNIALAAP